MMTFTMSIWLLVAIFTRLVNFLVVEIDKRAFDASWLLVHDVLRRLEMTWVNTEYARLEQELRLDCDSFQRYFRMSTEQFDYVLGLVMGPHISRLPTMYVAVYVQGHTTS